MACCITALINIISLPPPTTLSSQQTYLYTLTWSYTVLPGLPIRILSYCIRIIFRIRILSYSYHFLGSGSCRIHIIFSDPGFEKIWIRLSPLTTNAIFLSDLSETLISDSSIFLKNKMFLSEFFSSRGYQDIRTFRFFLFLTVWTYFSSDLYQNF